MKAKLIALAIIWLGFFALVGWLATVQVDLAAMTMILGMVVLVFLTAFTIED